MKKVLCMRFFSLLFVFGLFSACTVEKPLPTTTPTVAIPSPTPVPPTITPQPTNTPEPTREPPSSEPDDKWWRGLKESDYKVYTNASLRSPDGYIDFAYVLVQSSKTTRRVSCIVAFYRWDGYKFIFLDQRQTDVLGCSAINWDTLYKQDSIEHRALNLNGYWSDINNNGLPELSVFLGVCETCGGATGGNEMKYYEIQKTGSVNNIVGYVRGQVSPWHIFHAENPLTIYSEDQVIYGYYYDFITVRKIYQWDKNIYIDVSQDYIEEYRADITTIVTNTKKLYGQPMQVYAKGVNYFLPILIASNEKVLSPKEALEIFMELTDLAHWPGSKAQDFCWLQLARAYAQIDSGGPFRIFSPRFPAGANDLSFWVKGVDAEKYDVSLCKGNPYR